MRLVLHIPSCRARPGRVRCCYSQRSPGIPDPLPPGCKDKLVPRVRHRGKGGSGFTGNAVRSERPAEYNNLLYSPERARPGTARAMATPSGPPCSLPCLSALCVAWLVGHQREVGTVNPKSADIGAGHLLHRCRCCFTVVVEVQYRCTAFSVALFIPTAVFPNIALVILLTLPSEKHRRVVHSTVVVEVKYRRRWYRAIVFSQSSVPKKEFGTFTAPPISHRIAAFDIQRVCMARVGSTSAVVPQTQGLFRRARRPRGGGTCRARVPDRCLGEAAEDASVSSDSIVRDASETRPPPFLPGRRCPGGTPSPRMAYSPRHARALPAPVSCSPSPVWEVHHNTAGDTGGNESGRGQDAGRTKRLRTRTGRGQCRFSQGACKRSPSISFQN
eukprot:gene22341-biopygen23717